MKVYDNSKYRDDLIKYAESKNRHIDLDNPVTFNDKINWIKLYGITDVKVRCADKVNIHEYCKEVLGKDICVPIIKIYDHVDDIDFDNIPQQCVIKCNHGCGFNIIVKDKDNIDIDKIKKKLNKWMSTDFAFIAGYEMQYHYIDRKIFIEKYIGDAEDYKFWCFNGEPLFWTYSLSNDGGFSDYINYYDLDGELTEICNNVHPRNPNVDPFIPDNFKEMIEIAKKLANGFEYVRVDMYNVDGIIYLGELTFTPGAGWTLFSDEYANKLGSLIKLKK